MKYIALDIEAIGLKPFGGTVWSIAINNGKKIELFENCFGRVSLPASYVKMLADEDVCKVAHNAAYDACYLLMTKGYKIRNVWCTMETEKVIQGYTPPSRKRKKDGTVNYTPAQLALQKQYGTALKFVLPRYGFKAPDKEVREGFIDRPKGLAFSPKERQYMVDDVRDLLKVQKMQEFILKRDNLTEVAYLEHKMVERVVAMRARGIGFNSKTWREIATETEKEYNLRLSKLPKVVSNWGSDKQVKAYFRSKGIEITSYKEIESILYATRDKTLEAFIYAMELKKAVTTYGMNWFEDGYIDPDGRVRGDFTQQKETGRMSSHNPNLQNLPKKGRHRAAFVSAPGYLFGIGDFSGQEIGIMAAMADEKLWIDAMLRGDDVHSLTASLLYQAEWDNGYERGCKFPKKCDCPDHLEIRERAKTLNFMLAYGGGSQKFAYLTGLSMLESKIVIKRYKQIIPRITRCLDQNAKSALYSGESFSADPYKRRRLLMADAGWKIRNQGKNNPIQAAGANMLKLAMISMPESIPIVLVIHDEIITENKTKDSPKALKVLKKVMEQSADYITGIKGLIRVEPRSALTLEKPKKK